MSVVKIVTHTPDIDMLVARAALICYSNKPIDSITVTRSHARRLIHTLINNNHTSPLEHASITYSISNISRACLAQLTRHRMASYTVRSHRHVRINNFINPFNSTTQQQHYTMFNNAVNNSMHTYNTLLQQGVPCEVARAVLPISATTQLYMTANCRSLLNFFTQRLSAHAQDEIRALAHKMHDEAMIVAPFIFKHCSSF